MQINAAVVHEKNGPFMMQNVDLVEPGADELLVRVVASGICHTDEFGRTGNAHSAAAGPRTRGRRRR